jgi:hypothetical protein
MQQMDARIARSYSPHGGPSCRNGFKMVCFGRSDGHHTPPPDELVAWVNTERETARLHPLLIIAGTKALPTRWSRWRRAGVPDPDDMTALAAGLALVPLAFL